MGCYQRRYTRFSPCDCADCRTERALAEAPDHFRALAVGDVVDDAIGIATVTLVDGYFVEYDWIEIASPGEPEHYRCPIAQFVTEYRDAWYVSAKEVA